MSISLLRRTIAGPPLALRVAAGVPPAGATLFNATIVLPASDRYVPSASVLEHRLDDVTVLTSARTGERHTLSATEREVWTLLHEQRQTVDRLVIKIARRSPGQALVEVPDRVREQLDHLVERGLVQRVADL